MLCSVGYHLFACHRSEKTSLRWLSLDYAGISVGILGCYVPGIFYAFYCDTVSFNAGDGELCEWQSSRRRPRAAFLFKSSVFENLCKYE